MRRLKAILSPVPTSGVRQRLTVLGLGVAVAAVAGTSAWALSAQREAVVAPQPAVFAAQALPASAPSRVDARPMPALTPVAAAVPLPKAEPAPSPSRVDTRPMPALAPLATLAALPRPAPAPAPRPTPAVRPQAQVITNPSWSRHPMPLSYPAAALEQGSTGGSADLSCTVQADGRVSACTVLNETPVGLGYGAAALQAAAEARLSPRSVEGVAVGGSVRFTIRFTMSS